MVIFGYRPIHIIKLILSLFSLEKLELREPMEKLFEVQVPLSGIYSACTLGSQIWISLSEGNELKKRQPTSNLFWNGSCFITDLMKIGKVVFLCCKECAPFSSFFLSFPYLPSLFHILKWHTIWFILLCCYGLGNPVQKAEFTILYYCHFILYFACLAWTWFIVLKIHLMID